MSKKAWVVCLCGVVIVLVAEGLRRVLGLFLVPISEDMGLSRQYFGLVLAGQAIVFGMVQPVLGLASDRFGAARTLVIAAIVYALGLWIASIATSGIHLMLSLGVLVGVGLAGTTHNIVLGAAGRAVSNERRGVVFGTVIAAGSLGMFLLSPLMQFGIDSVGWRDTFLVAAVVVLLLTLFSLGLMDDVAPANDGPPQSVGQAIQEARTHRGYLLRTAGFFVCGFHVMFISTHLPAFFRDEDLSPAIGAKALALIGLANIFGAYICGWLGDRYRKKNLLCYIYLARSVAFGAVLVIPINDATAIGFAIVIGVLWLGTVPLTSGIVAQIFGTRYFSMLFGMVLASHQLGSFAGAWLGGLVYDLTGSYDLMWMLAVLAGIVAAVIHWPSNDRPLARLAAQPA